MRSPLGLSGCGHSTEKRKHGTTVQEVQSQAYNRLLFHSTAASGAASGTWVEIVARSSSRRVPYPAGCLIPPLALSRRVPYPARETTRGLQPCRPPRQLISGPHGIAHPSPCTRLFVKVRSKRRRSRFNYAAPFATLNTAFPIPAIQLGVLLPPYRVNRRLKTGRCHGQDADPCKHIVSVTTSRTTQKAADNDAIFPTTRTLFSKTRRRLVLR